MYTLTDDDSFSLSVFHKSKPKNICPDKLASSLTAPRVLLRLHFKNWDIFHSDVLKLISTSLRRIGGTQQHRNEKSNMTKKWCPHVKNDIWGHAFFVGAEKKIHWGFYLVCVCEAALQRHCGSEARAPLTPTICVGRLPANVTVCFPAPPQFSLIYNSCKSQTGFQIKVAKKSKKWDSSLLLPTVNFPHVVPYLIPVHEKSVHNCANTFIFGDEKCIYFFFQFWDMSICVQSCWSE